MDTSISDFTIIANTSPSVSNFETIESKSPASIPVGATSLSSKAYAATKAVGRYTFGNIATVGHNFWHGKTALTSDNVLLRPPERNDISRSIRPKGMLKQHEVESLKATLQRQFTGNETHIEFIHTPTNMLIPHSTMLAAVTREIGGTKETAFIFFDPRGYHPNNAKLLDPIGEIQTVQDLYYELVKEMENPPPLYYNNISIQGDVTSCTAYVAVFMDETCTAMKNGDSIQTFIQDICDRKVITRAKARQAVSDAAARAKAERAQQIAMLAQYSK